MTLFRSMAAILSRLKVKNGKNIEKSVHPLSLRCVSVLDLFVQFLNENFLLFPPLYQRNNKLVWDAAFQTMNGLFNEVWAGKDIISVDHAVEITLPV